MEDDPLDLLAEHVAATIPSFGKIIQNAFWSQRRRDGFRHSLTIDGYLHDGPRLGHEWDVVGPQEDQGWGA